MAAGGAATEDVGLYVGAVILNFQFGKGGCEDRKFLFVRFIFGPK